MLKPSEYETNPYVKRAVEKVREMGNTLNGDENADIHYWLLHETLGKPIAERYGEA